MNQDESLGRWQTGDAAAFARLVNHWQARVARFLCRMVGNCESIHDLCQEVFLRVYLARGRYREQGNFSTWLFQIAVNVARDALRRKPTLFIAQPEREADMSLTAETVYEQQELLRILDEELARLPPPLREVLVLRHYENMTFEDMSRTVDVPASTLKSRFAVALERLRLHLKERGYSHEEIR